MKKLLRLYFTVKDLRWQQVFFRLWHPLKRSWHRPSPIEQSAIAAACNFPAFQPFALPAPYPVHPGKKTFAFLNLEKTFTATIDWNFKDYGLLWTFHLNYLDWLRDDQLSDATKMAALEHYAQALPQLKVGLASYPSSVRIINIIRYLASCRRPPPVLQLLWEDAHRIAAFPELHLLGNHFLENAFALFHAAHFFNNNSFYKKSRSWLLAQLKEQILPDGAHFERSPAYHLHVLMRVLQCLELIAASGRLHDQKLNDYLKEIASRMLGWAQAFADSGLLPHFGDSNDEMAPGLPLLQSFAASLGIASPGISLKESNYRKLTGAGWTVWLNAGTPGYQPGHAHADPLSIAAFHEGRPILTHAGISTYENRAQRHWERSTAAHSTPVINQKNAADVWASFRMGRKAVTLIHTDEDNKIVASHNGYRREGVTVEIFLEKASDNITILYRVKSVAKRPKKKSVLHLYFPPFLNIQLENQKVFSNGRLLFQIKPKLEISLSHYFYAPGFHLRQESACLKITFEDRIELVFEF